MFENGESLASEKKQRFTVTFPNVKYPVQLRSDAEHVHVFGNATVPTVDGTRNDTETFAFDGADLKYTYSNDHRPLARRRGGALPPHTWAGPRPPPSSVNATDALAKVSAMSSKVYAQSTEDLQVPGGMSWRTHN